MEVFADVKKIVNQVLGRGNMFGFQTTLANQLYLIHCITNYPYFTDKIHRKTKYVWFCWSNSTILLISLSILLFPIYCNPIEDVLVLTYIGFVVAITSILLIVNPAIAQLLYATDIVQMIWMADRIISKSQAYKHRLKPQVKKMITNVVIAILLLLLPYTCVTFVDMALFYEEEKVKDYVYYLTPYCGVDRYGSLTLYILYTAVTVTVGAPFFLAFTTFTIFPVFWTIVCCNEAQRLIDELNTLSSEHIDIGSKSYKTLKSRFKIIIRKSLKDINDLTKMISYFRGYFETTAGVIMPIFLYIEIIHGVIMVTPGYPYIVRIRELSAFLVTIIIIYMMCWVGAKLEDLATDLSFAVYSTPWYWLKSDRKDVYILLCQAQSPIQAKALSVYPLNLPTFMRFCNSINSAVNVFRAYAMK